MRKDVYGSTNHLHFHDGGTCHGYPTASEAAEDAIRHGDIGRILEQTDINEKGEPVRCYSLIVGKFDHWAKHGKFVVEIRLVAVQL